MGQFLAGLGWHTKESRYQHLRNQAPMTCCNGVFLSNGFLIMPKIPIMVHFYKLKVHHFLLDGTISDGIE
jgi:hypothetical protein